MAPAPPLKDKGKGKEKEKENDKDKDKGKERGLSKTIKLDDGFKKPKADKLSRDEIKRQKEILAQKIGELTEENERKVLQKQLDSLDEMDEYPADWNPGGGEELGSSQKPQDWLADGGDKSLPGASGQPGDSANGQSNLGNNDGSGNGAGNDGGSASTNSNGSGLQSGGAVGGGVGKPDANSVAASIEAPKVVEETFLGHPITRDSAEVGEEVLYRQLSGGAPKSCKLSKYAKPMGHHVNKKLMLIAYGPPTARTWRLEDERMWIVEGQVTIISDRHNRYAHGAYPHEYKGLVGVSFEATKDFRMDQLSPERKKKDKAYPFVMLACRWEGNVVTHEIRSDWVKVKNAKQPLEEIYETARIQERTYSEWWAMLSAEVQSTVVKPLAIRDVRSIKHRSGRYETVTPGPGVAPGHRYRSATPGRDLGSFDLPQRRQKYPDRRLPPSVDSESESDEDASSSDSDEMPAVDFDTFAELWCSQKEIEATSKIKNGKGQDGKALFRAYAAFVR